MSLQWVLLRGRPALVSAICSLVLVLTSLPSASVLASNPSGDKDDNPSSTVSAICAPKLDANSAGTRYVVSVPDLNLRSGPSTTCEIVAELDRTAVEPWLERWGERLSVAGLNGPSQTTISGDSDALGELIERCAADGVHARRVAIDYAAHSAQVETIRDELIGALAAISPSSGRLPFHSTVTGGPLDTAELDAEYWYRNEREPVQLAPVPGRSRGASVSGGLRRCRGSGTAGCCPPALRRS